MDLLLSHDSLTQFPAAPPRYRIDALCGRGGTGSVYRAWDAELTRWVALKFLHDDQPQHRLRMLREARAQARIDHPNVCRIFDVGEQSDRLYIAMQWIDGSRLESIAPELSTEQRAAVMRDVADAIHCANAIGIIHRDVKPANVLVERKSDGTIHPYVVDFGLARISADSGTTATGDILGTPQYLSPEQAWGLPVDRRSDVYSLGATLYHLLAGSPPFHGASSADVLMQVITRDPKPLRRISSSIPRELSIVAEKCLQKEPQRRYDSARELRDELDRWLRGEPVMARAPGLVYRARAFVRRNRATAAAVAAATLLTGVAAAAAVWSLQKEQKQRDLIARLEDRVRYIERLVQYDRSLPLHDTRPAVARVAREVAALSRERGAGAGGAPLLYAIGRARLAVADVEGAHDALERAWQSGLRTPAVGFYLGVALVDEYARALSDAERITPDELRRAKVKALREHYRRAAIPPLLAAREFHSQPAELIEARIAFIDGNDRRAVRLTTAVLERFPWNTDARLLRAEALLRGARADRNAGKFSAAREAALAAASTYEQARITAPSDIRVVEGLCSSRMLLLQTANDTSRGEEEAFALARAACEDALRADSQRVTVLTTLSAAWTQVGFFRSRNGGDAEAALQEAIAIAERALQIAPDDPNVLIEAGSAYYWMPLSYAPRVASYMRQALAADPSSVHARHALGRALLRLSDYLQSKGDDPRAVLREAAEHYREVIRRAPSYINAYQNLGFTLSHFGDYALRTGADAEPHYKEIIELLEPMTRVHPEAVALRYIIAYAWRGIGLSRKSGEAASAAFQRAREMYDSALALNADHHSARLGRASLLIEMARLATDPATRTNLLASAASDLEHGERRGNRSEARIDWYILLATTDRKAAARHIAGAERALQGFTRTTLADHSAAIALHHGRIERARCRLELPGCDEAAAERYFSRALAKNPLLAWQVARARLE